MKPWRAQAEACLLVLERLDGTQGCKVGEALTPTVDPDCYSPEEALAIQRELDAIVASLHEQREQLVADHRDEWWAGEEE